MTNDDAQRLADLVWLRDNSPSKFLAVRVLAGRVAFRDSLGSKEPNSLRRLAPVLRSYGLSPQEIAYAANDAAASGLLRVTVNPFFGVDLEVAQ